MPCSSRYRGEISKKFRIKMRLCDRWRVFSESGNTRFLYTKTGIAVFCKHGIVNTGWHHEKIVPDVLA